MGNPIIWFGEALKALKDKIVFFNDVSIQSGNLNPTVTPVDGEPGSQYNSTLTSAIYVKQDSGSSTNWSLLDDASNEIPSGGTTGQALVKDSNSNYDVEWASIVASVGITIDGGGSVITTGSKGYITVPYSGIITEVTLLADVSGSIVIDIKKSTYSGFPTTTSICASAKPTLSSAQKSNDATLTGWTTTITAGDVLEFNVDSATTLTRVNLVLKVDKT